VAHRDHGPDVLVADREARLDRDPAVVDVQVRPADARRLDADDRVGRRLDLGIRLLGEGDLAGRLEGHGVHGRWTLARRPALELRPTYLVHTSSAPESCRKGRISTAFGAFTMTSHHFMSPKVSPVISAPSAHAERVPVSAAPTPR